jgi:diacylglycerol kinase family enzyme
MKNVLVLLNARAGTLLDIGADSVVGQVETALKSHCEKLDVRLISPREMRKAIKDAAVGPHDTVIVGGGDGSASTAVAEFSGSDKVLGVLPFGTMNLLARDLGMPTEPEAAIAALAKTTPRRIDLAEINGRPFHTLSGLGFFSHMARAREEVRGHPLGRLVSVVLAWFRALVRTSAFDIDVVIDGRRERITALAALVTSNAFGADWRRPRLDGGTLELHLVEDQGALTKLKAGAALLTGTWRDDPGIRNIAAREIVVSSARRHTHAATDGELIRERMPLRYRVLPQALTVLGIGDET